LYKTKSERGEAKSAPLYATYSTFIQSRSDCLPARRLRRCFQFSCFAESASALAKSNDLIAQKRHAAPFGSILGFATTAGAAGAHSLSLFVFCFPCALFGVCIYLFWGGERGAGKRTGVALTRVVVRGVCFVEQKRRRVLGDARGAGQVLGADHNELGIFLG
jgi:hypothetical protein